MKRKRNESTTISNKILYLQNGSNVDVQLDDGKWHPGIILQSQLKKYLVQVEEQQYWIDLDLIKPNNTTVDHKNTTPFEYRPGKFLRNETKSKTKIVSDEKFVSSSLDSPLKSSQIDTNKDSKRKRFSRSTLLNNEEKKSPFVWKPNTSSAVQTRRSSRSNNCPSVCPEENILVDNHCRTRSLSSNTIEDKPLAINNINNSDEIPSSEVLIFRPIIRFVDETINDQQSTQRISPKGKFPIDDENLIRQEEEEDGSTVDENCKDEYNKESRRNVDIICGINLSNDSRSSSRASIDNPLIINSSEINRSINEQQTKMEQKSFCFLETPPPSLPDINLTQESDGCFDKQFKSKRKQDRPQRKQVNFNSQGENKDLNGFFNNLFSNNNNNEESTKKTKDLSDRGYLSDEYNEPILSNNDLLNNQQLENFSNYLEKNQFDKNEDSIEILINQDDKILYEELIQFIYNNNENYNKINKYRLEYYHEDNKHSKLISNILEKIFYLFYNNFNRIHLFESIPNEMKLHIKSCLNNVFHKNSNHLTKIKRLNNNRKKYRNNESKRFKILNHKTKAEDRINNNNDEIMLSSADPSINLSSKIIEQEPIEELLSPNNNLINSGVIQQLSALPKERDLYEIIHCFCRSQIDNGFMIQCESCLCWSHCECVGVTTSSIPTSFKCYICTKAENERQHEFCASSMIDDEMTLSFLNPSNSSEKLSLFLSYSRRLWNLREQIIELKLRYTPKLRSLQNALRCDDLMELFNYTNMKSDELIDKIEQRKNKRIFFESIAQTINYLMDSVCSSVSTSSCLSIEFKRKDSMKARKLNDQMNILICHLSDDEQTRRIRLLIQNRYEHLMSFVDNKIQTILIEHKNIQTQMAFELGIIPNTLSNDYLSYDKHELSLRITLDRLKS